MRTFPSCFLLLGAVGGGEDELRVEEDAAADQLVVGGDNESHLPGDLLDGDVAAAGHALRGCEVVLGGCP